MRIVKILAVLFRKAGQLLLLGLLVTSATFLLASLIPGDFYSQHELDPTIRPETLSELRSRHGLDQPLRVQYARWLQSLVRLDLGHSLYYQSPVRPVVQDALASTLWIGVPALCLGFLGGVLLGALHAVLSDRPLGSALDFLSTIALSLPTLVLGLLALILASRTLWFPLGGMSSSALIEPGPLEWLADRLHHLALPVLCLTIPVLASVERLQFAATRSALEAGCVRAARARGVSRGRIFTRHVLRPSLNPTLSTSGPIFAAVLSGSLILEVMFAWPGLGQVTYNALFHRDVYLLAGCVVGSSLILVAANLASDSLLWMVDPRTRAASRGEVE